jgi:hypothetical protein
MRPEIEGTINRLQEKDFNPDPLVGSSFSRIVSVMSSAYKRHGNILEKALLHQLEKCPRLIVWDDPLFQVTPNADLVAQGSVKTPETILGNHLSYGEGHRTLQVDIIVYDTESKIIRAYEVKRGFGYHDAGKKRSILRDTLCLNLLLKSYGEQRGYEVRDAEAKAIFYYGSRSIPKQFSLIAQELDEHFQWPVYQPVEEVNRLFRDKLLELSKNDEKNNHANAERGVSSDHVYSSNTNGQSLPGLREGLEWFELETLLVETEEMNRLLPKHSVVYVEKGAPLEDYGVYVLKIKDKTVIRRVRMTDGPLRFETDCYWLQLATYFPGDELDVIGRVRGLTKAVK